MSATICFNPKTSRSGLDNPSNVFAFETRIVDRKLHPSTLGYLSSISAALLDFLPCARIFAPRTPSTRTIPDHEFHIHDPFQPRLPLHSPSSALHAFERRPPALPHVNKDPTAFKDILRDHEWFASTDELENIIVSMNPPLRHSESDVPGLRELQGSAFGNLPRPPEVMPTPCQI